MNIILRKLIDIYIKFYCRCRNIFTGKKNILFYSLNMMNYNMFKPIIAKIPDNAKIDIFYCFKDFSEKRETYINSTIPKDKIVSLNSARLRIWDSIFLADFLKPKYLWRKEIVYTCHGVAAKKWTYVNEFGENITDDYRYNYSMKEFENVFFHNEIDYENSRRRGILMKETSGEIIGMCCLDEVIKNNNPADINRIKRKYVPKEFYEKKIVMYAPTWDPQSSFRRRGKEILEALSEIDAFIVIKPHPLCVTSLIADTRQDLVTFLQNTFRKKNYLLVSDTPYEIMPIVDMMVSDFGSIAFEFSILKRPMYFFDGNDIHEKIADNDQYELLKKCAIVFNEKDEITKDTFKFQELKPNQAESLDKLQNMYFSNLGCASEKAVEALIKRKIIDI